MGVVTGIVVPDGVGKTAIAVAHIRAQESLRPDRLFDDPYATRFLAAAGWAAPVADADESDIPARWLLMFRSVVVRTRFLDDLLLAAACPQVVLLAAGLDTRAFRLDWAAGTRVLELDLPEMVDFKEAVMADVEPKCARTVVGTDLLADWPADLLAAGFRPELPTAWVAEGLLMYFTPEQNEELLARVGAMTAPGSHLALTVVSQHRLDHMRATNADPGAEVVDMWQSGAPDDPVAWLATHGWQATAYDPAERAAGYGRPAMFDGLDFRAGPRGLISASR